MIPVGQDEILSHSTGSWQCCKFFINYILLLHVKSVILAKPDPSCTAGTPICWDKIFPCTCFNLPKQDEKVNEHISLKISTEVHFNRTTHMT